MSKELDKKLEKFDKIYEHAEGILGDDGLAFINNVFGTKPKRHSDEKLRELNEYARTFLEGDKESGILRTILVIIKPYKTNAILKDTFDELVKKLEEKRGGPVA